jgi:hypothetical protein
LSFYPPVDNERDDFAGKLLLIEKQASLCAQELPAGTIRGRIEEIATTAKLLRLRLGIASAAILPPRGAEDGAEQGLTAQKL